MLVAVLASAGFYLFFARLHAPRVARTDVLQTRVQEMLERNDEAAGLEAAVSGLEERLVRYEQHVARMETLIPARDEVAQLLEAVSREERRTGVAVTMMRPQPPATEEFYERRSYDLAVEGAYHAVGAFLTGVASLDRIVVPDNVLVASSPDPERAGEALATFQISAYVVPAAPEPPTAAAPSLSGLQGATRAAGGRAKPANVAAPGPPGVRGAGWAATERAKPVNAAAPGAWGLRGASWAAERAKPANAAAPSLSGLRGAVWAAAPGLSGRRGATWAVAAPRPRSTLPPWLQEAPSPTPEEAPPVPLVFEREVFRYPVAGRRNPFAVPGRERAVLPVHAPVRLLGLVFHDDPRLRMAILTRDRLGRDALPGGGRPLRLRIGEQAGDVRLLEVVAAGVVVVETQGPQGAQVDTLALPRPAGLSVR